MYVFKVDTTQSELFSLLNKLSFPWRHLKISNKLSKNNINPIFIVENYHLFENENAQIAYI